VQNPDENIPRANQGQQLQAPVTTEDDEMKMAVPVAADQSFAHGAEEESKTTTLANKSVGHPEKPNQSLGVGLLEWYHSIVSVHQQTKIERVAHPPDRASTGSLNAYKTSASTSQFSVFESV